MRRRRTFRAILVVAAAAGLLATSCARSGAEGQATSAPARAAIDPELAERLAHIDRVVENKRRELDVPGVALAIVKDGQVIHTRGYGYSDLAEGRKVTTKTLFAIGSSTKAFTAMTTLIAEEEGKLSLDDSPKKCIPFFKLRDPEADANIKVRDLLTHSSGLGRTDESWAYGDLTREDAIRIAGLAKPLVKLGEAWNYQNTMYTAAGECAARSFGVDYYDLVGQKIFAPLGMESSNLTIDELKKSPDRAIGYEISYADDGEVEGVIPSWLMNIDAVAPAGSINSNAEDMAKWLAFVLSRGETTRLVSKARMDEFLKPQMRISDKSHYALGWFVDKWKVYEKVHHGGNVAGFSAMVAMLPKKDLGYVMLTNMSATPLSATIDDAVFSLAFPKKAGQKMLEQADPGDPDRDDVGPELPLEEEVGTYEIRPDPDHVLHAAVVVESGKLVLTVPGQPRYELSRVKGRKYKFLPPEAPRAFYVTFRQNADDPSKAEAYFEQPNGKVVMRKIADDPKQGLDAAKLPEQDVEAMKDLLGIYEAPKMRLPIKPRIVMEDGTVVVSGVGGIQGIALVPMEEKDRYGLHGAPGVVVIIHRDQKKKVTGLEIDVQGKQEIEFERTADLPPELPKPKMSADQLMKRVVRAHGWDRLAKHQTVLLRSKTTREHEGMGVDVVSWRKAPDLLATRETFTALDKTIMVTGLLYDGERAVTLLGKYEPRKLRGRALNNARVAADFNSLLNYKTVFESVEIKRATKLDGKKVYVVEFRPKDANVITAYFDAKTYLMVRRDTRTLGTSVVSEARFEDYRSHGGIKVPHRTTTGAGATEAVTEVVEVKLDPELPEGVFKSKREVYDPEPLQVK
jgi:CubicO group peptidase (beta-lactamase class C family)